MPLIDFHSTNIKRGDLFISQDDNRKVRLVLLTKEFNLKPVFTVYDSLTRRIHVREIDFYDEHYITCR